MPIQQLKEVLYDIFIFVHLNFTAYNIIRKIHISIYEVIETYLNTENCNKALNSNIFVILDSKYLLYPSTR
jgi:hypothetical protein